MTRRGEELEERLLEFAARIGKVVDALPNTRLGRHVAGQLVRSGTSPAPNYAEACGAESKRDFIHKLGICLWRTANWFIPGGRGSCRSKAKLGRSLALPLESLAGSSI